ncbi:DUF1735 domain-containing protein [Mucilaginibacter aquatilis]|uniref:DUF1735 domain-containing protein n=1 Tax=Mucilaginibacter aquatilis TaxID=1517760 RepID=A0A6I4IRC1_9SPHI|nr:DUF1735 domain-containing protein [Mucilaginibacter aquatilis]MVN92574.1 DUF1735 domain-containing protein [Mucilaginibacter aquatilis]
MKKFTKILTFAAIALSLTSCLKDKGYEDDKYGINVDEVESYKIINIPSTNTSLTVSNTYARTAANATLTIPVHLSAKDPAAEPINVSLAVDADETKITNYNNTLAAASRYTRMPAAGYTLNSGTATIASGSRDASTTVTIKPGSLSAGRYIIPLSITGTDKQGYTISGNQGYRLLLVIITN